MHDLPQPVAVVCHDAGAANIVLAEVRAHPGVRCLAVMEGPAARLWEAAGSPHPVMSLEQALVTAGSVLSGTGWASDLEHDARRRARALGLRSIAVVDHWVNYRARFERRGEVVLPDELWVTDPYALALAAECFPGLPVRERPNLYLRAQVEAITRHGPARPGQVLFLMEPIRYSWPGLNQPGEIEALDYLLGQVGLLGLRGPLRLRLRPHPSDPPGKYDAWLAAHAELDAAIDAAPTLAEAIAAAECVAGCETAALVVALAAGKTTVASLPPAAPRCRLPHEGLIHLRDLAGTSGAATGPAPPLPR
jgi:hypothetical protein